VSREWTDTVLVLQMGTFREADLWVRLLAQAQGLLTAFAFGASRSRRRFTGCLDTFNRIRVRARTSRDGRFLNLEEATLLHGPSRLRTDWHRQGMATNCVRFLEALGVPPDAPGPAFSLLCSLLDVLEQDKPVPDALPLLFRFRLASDQGYAPNLHLCSACGRQLTGAFILISEGLAVCPSCRAKGTGRGLTDLALGPEALDVLCKVQEYSPDLWGASALTPDQWRQTGRFIDAFVRYHLGLEWAHGRFRTNQ